MSRFKDQIFAYLKTVDLRGNRILSIGAQEDDRRYFKNVEYDEWLTLDSDSRHKPNITLDMNLPIVNGDGDLTLDNSYGESFDILLALNLWEYVYNPYAAHDNLAFFLKAQGILYTNYPFVYALHEPRGTDYLRYTPEGARRLLTEAGFEILDEKMIDGSNLLISFYQNEGMKARANEDHRVVGTIIKAKKI